MGTGTSSGTSATASTSPCTLSGAAARPPRTGPSQVPYVKLVIPTSLQHTARLSFTGVSRIDSTRTLAVLTRDPSARNTLAAPDTIAPVTKEVSGLSTSSRLVLPPSSVSVLRVTGA